MSDPNPLSTSPPKVSLVVPSYNYARYLDERIQSLLNQTYGDFELIITDDASTDDSRDVIMRYASDPRLRPVFFKENSGSVYQRWNDGAALARGEYLMFPGADDSCQPTLLERLVPLLDANPTVGLAYSQVWITDSDGKRLYIKAYADHPEHWAADFINNGPDECRDYLFLRNTIPTASSLLMRRSLFEEVGPFDTTLQLSADWMLYARMLLQSDVAYVAEPLVDFRTHPNTARMSSAKSLRHVDDDYGVADYIARAAHIDNDRLDQIRNKLAKLWAGYILGGRGLDDPGRFRAVYKKARQLDPDLGPRLLKQLVYQAPTARVGRLFSRAIRNSAKRAATSMLGTEWVDAYREKKQAGSKP